MIHFQRAPRMDSYGRAPHVGAVSYLNSKPLIEGLSEFLPHVRLTLDLPSRLADKLARNELDVALIPSIEAFADPDYEILSDACVATRGPVLSVKLYCRVPPGDIRTLALDEGSRTSAALVRVILHERFGVTPHIEPLPMGRCVEQTNADAVLLIGDRAMHAPAESFHTSWDLGEEWLQWTGLPFVFAMWVGRPGTSLDAVAMALGRARDQGVRRLAAIADREAPALGISRQMAHLYLSQNLHFRLGSAERSGLTLFHRLASRLGIVPETTPPRFHKSEAPAPMRRRTRKRMTAANS